ncbi:MAG TPA: hypothetical protein VNV87_02460 [Acidimicrobiales bacterium]|nr:hypothetical protein [Acidimicrobiales bacterium]
MGITVAMLATWVGGPGISAANAANAKASYDVPIDIDYGYIWSGYLVGKFVPSESKCATGQNFDYQMKVTWEKPEDHRFGTRKTYIIPAAKFAVDTSWSCFGKQSKAVYDISMSKDPNGSAFNGPVRLTVSQVGPRYFVSACTDKFPINTSCSVVGAPVKPTVILHV